MAVVLRSDSASRTVSLGRRLAPLLRAGDVLALCGDLGAGKTTLIKGVAEGLGLAEPVTSPTFNILVVHPGGALTLNHFDLYRLEHAEQLADIDFWGVVESDGVSLIEWGDRFPGFMPEDLLTAEFSITGDEQREIALSATGPRAYELAREWERACSGGARS